MGSGRGSHRDGAAAVEIIKVQSQFPIWVSARMQSTGTRRVLFDACTRLVRLTERPTCLCGGQSESRHARTPDGLAPHYLSQPS